jgi:hypothetical protein
VFAEDEFPAHQGVKIDQPRSVQTVAGQRAPSISRRDGEGRGIEPLGDRLLRGNRADLTVAVGKGAILAVGKGPVEGYAMATRRRNEAGYGLSRFYEE